MIRRSLIIALSLVAAASAGEVSSVNFLYSGGEDSTLEVRVKTKGECQVVPLKTTGQEVSAELKNCKALQTYQIGERGDFVKSASLKPAKGKCLFAALLKKTGSLEVKEVEGGYLFKVSPQAYRPKISVLKTLQGEELLIELPPGSKSRYEKTENKLIVNVYGPRLSYDTVRPKSLLVREVSVIPKEEGGRIVVNLSPQVGAVEVVQRGNAFLATLYRKGTSASPSNEAKKIILKFSKADVRAVVKAIADFAGINVVFDPDVRGEVTVDFKKPVSWKEALKAVLDPLQLTYVETPDYYRIVRKDKLLAEEKLEPVKTYFIPLNYVKAKEIVENIKELLQVGGEGKKGKKSTSGSREKVTYNEDSNTLILKVTESHYKQIERLLKAIDRPKKQVLIKAKIVLVSSKAEKNLGFTWYISGYNRMGNEPDSAYLAGSYGFNTSGYIPLINPNNLASLSSIPVMDNTLALGVLNSGQNLRVELALKALELDGDAKLISSPKVLTLDNQEATIEQGIEIPYRNATVAAGGATTYEIEFKKASLILKVKPHITESGKILMDVEVRKDSPNYEYVAITGNNEPAINTRNVKSRIIVNDGSTVVIGGIYEKEKTKNNTGVPVLSKIPLLGWLFKGETTKTTKSQLLIFITPTVVGPEGEVNPASEEGGRFSYGG